MFYLLLFKEEPLFESIITPAPLLNFLSLLYLLLPADEKVGYGTNKGNEYHCYQPDNFIRTRKFTPENVHKCD